MKDLVSSVSGLRGIVGPGMNVEIIVKYASAFGIFSGGGKIVIGRDTRPTGKMLTSSLIASLEGVGCDVIDLGIVPTPTVLFNVRSLNANGGIIVTASHNPVEWNALKFVSKKGMFLNNAETKVFHGLVDKSEKWVTWDKIGNYSKDGNGISRHIDAVINDSTVLTNEIRERTFKVVMDTVNGGGYMADNEMLKILGCEVIPINNKPDGMFPRGPEPVPGNLGMLSKAVIENNADIGFAVDPDADRLAIVDESGVPLGEEYTLPIVSHHVLERKKGPVATNYSTSSMMDYVAGKFGVPIYRTPVGEANVVEGILKYNAIIGGEGNGGVIYPEINPTRDSLTGIALVLSFFAAHRIKTSEIRKIIPERVIFKTKVSLEKIDLDCVLAKLKGYFKNSSVIEKDGLKIVTKEHWVHIRKSGTEPIVRIMTEGTNEEDAEAFYRKIHDLITEK
ncbi:MAG: phosphoglucosamine mutase [Proteobacteria bacterium]|nr:phosphoglucosamine mutase [Pseudomonadota bacterium]